MEICQGEYSQLEWLKDATPNEQPYFSMIVGWQTVRETIKSTVSRFNDKYFQQSESGHHEMNRSTLQRKSKIWEREVDVALKEGMRNGNQDVGGTCRHIWRRSDALWTFIRREDVEPTNNRAERALRPAIIKRNLSFGVDSESGSQFLERMLSIIATSEQQNIDTYHYLQSTLTAQLTGKPTPKLL